MQEDCAEECSSRWEARTAHPFDRRGYFMEASMTEDTPRQGRQHIVVMTVRIRHALDAHDALAAVLAGGGEVVSAAVAEGAGGAYDPTTVGAFEGTGRAR